MRNFEEVKVEDLKEGDMIDLENDPFADPFGAVGYTEDPPPPGCTNRDILRAWHDYEEDHDLLGFQYALVESAVTEGNGKDVTVYTDMINVQFPLGHTVKRYFGNGDVADLEVDKEQT
jgi:hypothetical protein